MRHNNSSEQNLRLCDSVIKCVNTKHKESEMFMRIGEIVFEQILYDLLYVTMARCYDDLVIA